MGLSSFLQIQSLGKSQRIAITLMRSEQPRSFLRHHRTTGGQHPHAKLYPLPLASSKNHLKSAETNLRPKLQLFCDYGLSQGAKRGFWSENAENQPRKGPFFPCGKQAGVPNRKKVAKALSFLFSQWVDCRNSASYRRTDRRNGAKSSERRRSLQSQEGPVRFDDRHSGGCPRRPIVPHADSHCSHR